MSQEVAGIASGLTAGWAECPCDTSHWEISADLVVKERQGIKENGEEMMENRKKGSEKLKMEGGK